MKNMLHIEKNQYLNEEGKLFFKHPTLNIYICANGYEAYNPQTGNIIQTAKIYKDAKKRESGIRMIFNIYDGSSYLKKKAHILLWEAANNRTVPEGYELHHIDGNRENNFLENLLLVTRKQHLQLHRFMKGAKFEARYISGDTLKLENGLYYNLTTEEFICNRKVFKLKK